MLKKLSKKTRIIFTIIAGIVAVLVISWIWYFSSSDKNGLPSNFVSYRFAYSRPEGKLYYPKAKIFSLNGMGQHMTEAGWGGAWSGAVLTSSDSPEKIYAWYDKWLREHQWKEDANMERIHVSTQTSSRDYRRGTRETFSVAIDDPKQLGWTLGKELPTNITIFEISYYIKPN